jgi:hypothetical protein
MLLIVENKKRKRKYTNLISDTSRTPKTIKEHKNDKRGKNNIN